jgi:dihydroxyacetone kinase DhaKLM complex PTS-EIIA-like component DhaM/phosphotransferase system HPr-like phosphotransfer protein
MVSIVIVSHSAKLAEGVRELALQMAADVPIAVAGGIDDPEQPIGTDAMAVMLAAIESVYQRRRRAGADGPRQRPPQRRYGAGDAAPEMVERVRLCAAPLVEGALAAAVQAAAGGSLDDVCAEAMGASRPSSSKCREPGEPQRCKRGRRCWIPPPSRWTGSDHPQPAGAARPAGGALCHHRQPLRRPIRVRKVGAPGDANAKSINQVATLGARQNDRITISASGERRRRRASELVALIESQFGEMEAEVEAVGAGEVAGASRRRPPPLLTPCRASRPRPAMPSARPLPTGPPARGRGAHRWTIRSRVAPLPEPP